MGLPKGPNWPVYYPPPVQVNILMVMDGTRLSYFKNQDFSLSDVLDTLNQSPWWVNFNVTKAHRGSDPGGTPDLPGFAFTNPGVDLSKYDEVWFFGDDGPDLTPDENAVIAQFMDTGGGVFATGDHEELGAGMGAGLLRAGLMRKWRFGGPLGDPPPVEGPTRHDTMVAGPDGHYDFYDQSDDRPQTISVRQYRGWSIFPWLQQSYPHPLLCGSKGQISVLPDHMHEGECAIPAPGNYGGTSSFGTSMPYATTTWPGTVRPELIADATVTAHVDDFYGSVNGKTFPVLAAYDGHQTSVGRIATDATWHHWFNVNLTGDVGPFTSGGVMSLPEAIDAKGFTASAQGKKYLAQIKEYHRNVAMWLAPKAKIDAMFATAVAGLPWVSPLNEYTGNEPIYLLGADARDAIGRMASQCIVSQWLKSSLPQTAGPLFDPTIGERPNGDPAPLRGLYLYREFALGGIVREVFRLRAARPQQQLALKDVQGAIDRGLRAGLGELIAYERRAAKHTERLAEALAPYVVVDERALATV
ncbi:MAG: hypothetical protein JO225_12020 [Candidatus Eremiobacteraeota bacterium]|nr:hypothetical protein [Candidatus Eremiobacteraeota bacterium]